MKKKNTILIILFVATTLILKAQEATNIESKQDNGLKIDNLDTTAILGNDFYRYATGGWTDTHPIPESYPYYTTFVMLRDLSTKRIQSIIEELSKEKYEKGTNAQKIGDLYKQGMDSLKLNTEKATPIASQLALINSAKTTNDIINLSGKLRHYTNAPFFDMDVEVDDKNSTKNILKIGQGGLGLGERDYYLSTDENTKMLRDGYLKLITNQFVNAGYTDTDAKKAANSVMKIETALAKGHLEKEKIRIPELNYHKLRIDQLNDSVARFNWNLFFTAVGVKDIKELDVMQIEPLSEAVSLIQTAPIEDTKAYLSWCLINSAANYLSDDFVNANFDFYERQMTGVKTLKPRYRRVVENVNNSLDEEIGQIYVTKYFSPKAKEKMIGLVENLKIALSERIANLDWMSEETKAKAQEKLVGIIVKIGYPDKWKDTSTLKIEGDSYWADIVLVNEFKFNDNLNKLNKPVDKTEWHMPPQMVNAYYSPPTNEICFPAAILQEPFFYLDGDDAINYGAIGMVIGHEMSHGFDDQGRKYDKDGNMADWWTAEDSKKFEKRTKVLVDFFDNIVVTDSLHANGSFTLGENIGDNGGIQIAYTAFLKTKEAQQTQKIDGFTPQQRFFLAYANLWATNITDQFIVFLTKNDVHSLGKWRVNGTLPQIDAWYDAFNITEKDSLFIPKEKRASIW